MSANDSRNTPQEIAHTVEAFFDGPCGVDPCSNASSVIAACHRFSLPDDGLTEPWHVRGTAYVNGPWSDLLPWVEKSVAEYRHGCEILFLSRTESATEWARLLSRTRVAHVQLHKRYSFPIEGQPPTTDTRPTMISYYGERVHRFAHVFRDFGDVHGRPL